MTQKWLGIAKLQEEIGELQEQLGKLQCILGKLHAYPKEPHPDEVYAGPLKQRLIQELADTAASTWWFADHNLNGEDYAIFEGRKQRKYDTYTEWLANGDHLVGVEVPDEED